MARRRREETDGKGAGGVTSSAGSISRSRTCLLVSLIVLVWNVGATGRLFLFENHRDKILPSGTRRDIGMPSPAFPAVDCAASGGAGTLTARQKYLLGRKVDINRAGRREISDLPGISDAVALSVVETRSRIGGFRRSEDLLLVRGIKEKRLKKILPFLAGFHNN